MRLFLLLFFSFLSIGVFAQAPAIQWAKTYGGSNIDNAKSIQPTLDGGYIVVGYSLSADGDITGNHGASDCWVAKLSNKGIIEWQRSYGGSRTDEGNYIQQTSDGGYIVAGATNSVDGDVAGWHPGTELGGITTDFWVLKLTSNGNIQWQKCYGGFLTERAYCIQQTTDGGYVVAGYANSLDGDVTGFHDSFGLSNSTDCWIIKITASGTLQWQKCYGGFYWDIATSIRQTSDGGYIVGGYENSRDGGDVKGSHNPASGALWSDYWILKLSSTGSLQWQKCLGGAEEDILYSILETTDGGYIAAGSAISNDGDVTGNHGSGQDYWIVKLNNSGGIVWQKSYGGIYADIATSIQQTADGGYIIAGGGCGGAGLPDNGDIKVNQGTTDFWLLKITSAGDIVWQKSLGGSGMETCEAVKTTPDGGYILAGTTRSNDGDVNGYHGNYDYWVVKLGPQCTGSIDIEASATNICSDSSVTFTSSIVNGGTSPVYQWKVNGINVGTNSSTFTTFSLRDNDSVVCILNSNAPCIANPIIRSDTIIMHIRKCSPVPPSLGCQDKNFFNLYQQANGDNFPRQSIVTADNSIIIIGENVIGRQGGYNSFITKISKDGNNQWFKLIEGNMSQVLSGLTELRDGNFIAIGGLRDATKVGFFLIKFDTNGNVLWRKDYNIPNVGESLGNMHLKEDIDGSIIIQTQFAERGLSFSDRPMIIKIDSTGTILFCKYYTPPGGISALYMQDFIIKDGYSYVVGGFYYGNSIKGILLKINNSTGNLSFCNLYNFNNGGVYFTQILPYKNDRFCIIGPDDINPQDTSLIFVIDTLGNCSSSKYFQFNIPGTPRTYGSAAITSGYDLLWVGDFRKPPLTLTSLTLSRINPETGIQYNKDFQQINLYPRISTTLISSDSSIIATGNKEDATGLYSIFFGKFSKEGELGCTPITIPSSFGSGISQVISLSMTTTNKSYPVFQTAYTAKPYPLLKDSICSSVNMCDTIKLTTGNTVCNTVDTLKIKIYKNPECTSTPSMTFDSQYLQLLSMSNSAINFKVLRSGSLKVYASIQTSCFQLKDSLTIQIMLSPSVLNLGPDTVLCPGNTILLNAKKGFATYQWQDGSTDSTLTVTQPGTYFVKTTNACGGVFYDTVIVSPHPPIPFDLGPDLSKCNADSLTISLPTGFLNYIWTPSYNNITTNTQTVIVFPSTDTIYIVRAEKTPGCFAYDSIRIKVYTSPKINLGTDTSLCGSDSLTLNAGVGFNKYLWNTGSLAQQITVNSAGAYSVTATTTQNCISKDTLTILAVTPNPFVALDHDSTLCAGTARVLNAGNFISYLWNTGNTSQTISVNNTGIYSVTVTDNNNCKGSDSTKIVTILPSPANFLPADTAVCSYGSVLIASKVSYAKYLWNTNGLTPSITITQPGVYWLQVIDKNNCSGRDSITVAQKDCMKGFYIPNAFSPNHDGKNDLFRPMLFGKVMLYEFAIYNQWGEIVFKSTDVSKGWDGNYKKLPQDTFVFVWTCKYQFENEPVKLEKGTVTLIR